MKRVNIILSTYNGERYLEQMLQSIIAQTYKNIDVWIRDDGSKDGTVEIIQHYCDQTFDGVRFHHVADDLGNQRYVRSFCLALEASGDADYYAFCDQDDYWHPDKIQRAVDVLSKQPEGQCFLYAAGYDICDLELNKIGVGKKTVPLEKMNVGRAFFNYGAGLGQGFTLVFNRALRVRAFQSGYMDLRGHDVWLWAVVSGLHGGYYYDDCSTASYRRHPDTVTKTGKGNMALWKWRFQAFMNGDIFDRDAKAIHTYRELFGQEMTSKEDQAFLRIFGDLKYKGKRRCAKAFYPYRLKPKLTEELALRFAFLCGKV